MDAAELHLIEQEINEALLLLGLGLADGAGWHNGITQRPPMLDFQLAAAQPVSFGVASESSRTTSLATPATSRSTKRSRSAIISRVVAKC